MSNQSALTRLNENITNIVERYNLLKSENDALYKEVMELKDECETKSLEIEMLVEQSARKDLEIEQIVEKIESIMA